MFSTKKALCLSLLVSFTVSISAEGRFDTLKSWITPKTVAITGLGIAALSYHYWVKRRTTQILNIDGHDFHVGALDLRLSNKEVINARIERGAYPIRFYHNTHRVVDTDSGKVLFGFNGSYLKSNNNIREIHLGYSDRLDQLHLPWNWIGCPYYTKRLTLTPGSFAEQLYNSCGNETSCRDDMPCRVTIGQRPR